MFRKRITEREQKPLCRQTGPRKTFHGIYKALRSLKKCKGGRSPREKVSFGSCVCVCVWTAGSVSLNASAPHIYKTRVSVWMCCTLESCSFGFWDSWANKTTVQLRDIFFPPSPRSRHANISGFVPCKYSIVHILLMIQRSKALVSLYCGMSKLAGVFASGQAAMLWWETSSSEWKQMIKIHLSHMICHRY